MDSKEVFDVMGVTKAELVVVGSLNMDLTARVERLPSRGETVTANHFQASPGGKGANQAVAAARLGAHVRMVGRVGRDSYGEALLSSLEANNVDVSRVLKDPSSPTGMALITVDDNGANTIVVVQGANGRCQPEDVEAAEEVISKAKALVVQLEIPLETVEKALQVAKRHSVATVLNPAPARRVPEGVLSHVDFLIPNEIEAAALCGCPVADPDTALKAGERLLEMGAGRAIITLGEQGAVFVGPEGGFHVSAFRVKAVDSTGAGDAISATVIFALLNDIPLDDAVRLGVSAAS